MTTEAPIVTRREDIDSFSTADSFNPIITLTESLAEHYSGVTVLVGKIDDFDSHDSAIIRMTWERAGIFQRLLDSPEMKTLMVASRYSHLGLKDDLTELDNCDWDNEQKKKVAAHYYTQRAKLISFDAQSARDIDVRVYAKQRSREFEQIAEYLLGDLSPLSLGEVREMTNGLVEKSLTTS